MLDDTTRRRSTVADEDPDGSYMRWHRMRMQAETLAIADALRRRADEIERLSSLELLDVEFGRGGQRVLRLRIPLASVDCAG